MSMRTARERKMSKCSSEDRYHQGLYDTSLQSHAFVHIHSNTKDILESSLAAFGALFPIGRSSGRKVIRECLANRDEEVV